VTDQNAPPPGASTADSLGAAIRQQRARLESLLSAGLQPIAMACATRWPDRDGLNSWLQQQFASVCCCQLLYVIDMLGRQYSANISRGGIDPQACGQDLSGRPYLAGRSGVEEFVLSDVYLGRNERRSCVTALASIRSETGERLGYLAADFHLRDLPQVHKAAETTLQWRQIKGDPAIRQILFQQQRIGSAMDGCLNRVHDIVHELITERGIFHAKLHYGSSRATLWLNADPRRYRIHVLEEITDPSVCLAYPPADYPEDATVDPTEVRAVLDRLVNLRLGDSVIYLRSASLNVVNGLVGLNFSCDGTHYLPVPEFLEKDHRFWFGA